MSVDTLIVEKVRRSGEGAVVYVVPSSTWYCRCGAVNLVHCTKSTALITVTSEEVRPNHVFRGVYSDPDLPISFALTVASLNRPEL